MAEDQYGSEPVGLVYPVFVADVFRDDWLGVSLGIRYALPQRTMGKRLSLRMSEILFVTASGQRERGIDYLL